MDRLRQEMARIRGAVVRDDEWEWLEWRYGDEITNQLAGDLVDDLADSPLATKETREPVERGDGPGGTSRSAALSALCALEAHDRDDVHAWRTQVLDGTLLPYDETLEAWLRDRAAIEGPRELLAYSTPDATFVRRVAVAPGSVLDDLRVVADDLARDYRWQPAQAVVFVLTGGVPVIPEVRVTVRRSSSPAASCIVLEADPWTDPRRLADIYQRVRTDATNRRRFRLPDKKSLAVVEFVANRNGEPTEAVRKEWNKTQRANPEWKYDDLAKFQRTYRETMAKVLDPKII